MGESEVPFAYKANVEVSDGFTCVKNVDQSLLHFHRQLLCVRVCELRLGEIKQLKFDLMFLSTVEMRDASEVVSSVLQREGVSLPVDDARRVFDVEV